MIGSLSMDEGRLPAWPVSAIFDFELLWTQLSSAEKRLILDAASDGAPTAVDSAALDHLALHCEAFGYAPLVQESESRLRIVAEDPNPIVEFASRDDRRGRDQ